MLGIVKAYATRVGAGPFPTELFDEFGEHLSRVGREFGSVTGRRRRCGWFDAVALRRSIVHSSCSSLCVTKLDVLDGLDTIRICVGYKMDGAIVQTPPLLSQHFGECEAVYEEHPGWKESSVGVTRYDELPGNARSYLERLQALGGRPHRPHLHRAGPRSDHHPAQPVRLTIGVVRLSFSNCLSCKT